MPSLLHPSFITGLFKGNGKPQVKHQDIDGGRVWILLGRDGKVLGDRTNCSRDAAWDEAKRLVGEEDRAPESGGVAVAQDDRSGSSSHSLKGPRSPGVSSSPTGITTTASSGVMVGTPEIGDAAAAAAAAASPHLSVHKWMGNASLRSTTAGNAVSPPTSTTTIASSSVMVDTPEMGNGAAPAAASPPLSDCKWMGSADLRSTTAGNPVSARGSAESGPTPLPSASDSGANDQGGPPAKRARLNSPVKMVNHEQGLPTKRAPPSLPDNNDRAMGQDERASQGLRDLRSKASVSLIQQADIQMQSNPSAALGLLERAVDVSTWGNTSSEACIRDASDRASRLAARKAATAVAVAAARKSKAAAQKATDLALKAAQEAEDASEASAKAAAGATKAAAAEKAAIVTEFEALRAVATAPAI